MTDEPDHSAAAMLARTVADTAATLASQATLGVGARLESHERVCAERWRACHETMGEIKGSIKGFQAQLWAAAGLVVVTLLGTVGFLFTKVLH